MIYAAQMPELLWTLFALGAMLLWRSNLNVFALVLAVLAFKAKESALVLPAIFLLHDLCFGVKRWRWHTLSGIAGLFAAFHAVTSTWGAVGRWEGHLSPYNYFVTSCGTYLQYLRLAFWPSGQSIDPGAGPDVSLAVAGVLAFGAAWLFLLRLGNRPVLFGFGMFCLWPLLMTSVFPLLDPMAEHRVYGGMAGLAIAVAALGGDNGVLRKMWAWNRHSEMGH